MAKDLINIDSTALMEIKTLCGLCADKIDEAYHKVDKASRHDGWWCGEIFWVENKLKGVAKNVNELKSGCVRLALEASSASTRFEECVKRANTDMLSIFNDTKMWEVVNDVYQGEVITPPGKLTIGLLSNITNIWRTRRNEYEMQGTTLDIYNSMVGSGIIKVPFISWADASINAISAIGIAIGTNSTSTVGNIYESIKTSIDNAVNNAIHSNNYQPPTPDLSSDYYYFYNNPNPEQGGGQCTGYTKGRIYELLGTDYLSNVWQWGGEFVDDAYRLGKGDYISAQQAFDGEILNLNCPAVCQNAGHVLVIENVVNDNGNIMISYSEANNRQYGVAGDGVIRQLSKDDFWNQINPTAFLRIKR